MASATLINYAFTGKIAGGEIEEFVLGSQSRFAVGDAFSIEYTLDTSASIGTPSASYHQAVVTDAAFTLLGSNPSFSSLSLSSGVEMVGAAVNNTPDRFSLAFVPDEPSATFTSQAPRFGNVSNESVFSRITILLIGNPFLSGNPIDFPTDLDLGSLYPYASLGDSTELIMNMTSDFGGYVMRGVLETASVSIVPEPSQFSLIFGLFAVGVLAVRRRYGASI